MHLENFLKDPLIQAHLFDLADRITYLTLKDSVELNKKMIESCKVDYELTKKTFYLEDIKSCEERLKGLEVAMKYYEP